MMQKLLLKRAGKHLLVDVLDNYLNLMYLVQPVLYKEHFHTGTDATRFE